MCPSENVRLFVQTICSNSTIRIDPEHWSPQPQAKIKQILYTTLIGRDGLKTAIILKVFLSQAF
jgi:hypothetical protein